MKVHHASPFGVTPRTAGAICFLFSLSTLARADLLTSNQLLALMIENQGDNAALIGGIFGPDKGSQLAFESFVDPLGITFSFSLTPTTYLGQSLTLSGTGMFDPTTNLLALSSSGSLGSLSWTTEGTEAVTLLPEGAFNSLTNINFLQGGVKVHDIHAEGFLRSDGITTGGFGFDTDEDGNEIPGSLRVFSDRQLPSGSWAFQSSTPGLGFSVSSEGFSPPGGGAGTFTTTIQPVPEPSLITLFMAFGFAGIAVVRILKR